MEVIRIDLNKNYAEAIERAVFLLQQGGVVVYPTDTLYGLGANALDPRAIKKVYKIKKRSLSKPLPAVVRNLRWAQELAFISPRNEEILHQIWPGKFTAVLPQKEMVPDILTSGSKTIGLRVADYPFLDALLDKFGYPLTSTSANIANDEPSQNIDVIRQVFANADDQPDAILDVGVLPPASSSTILDLTTDKPKILRIGATKPDQLLKLLELPQEHGL